MAPSRRREQFRFLARVHFWILGFSLLGYLALAFTLGPGFLAFDVSQKIRAIADELITVTAVVLGPPATPVVTATPGCVSGSPRIVLDWADDAATTTWDIDRDSAPLATGLTASGYTDTAVSGTNSYTYVVTAYGPMSPGIATSSSVLATAIDCSTLLPAATLTLTRIGDKNITPPRTLPIKVDENRPRFRGNTNIGNAIVDIALTRPTLYAQVIANVNGYFSWEPPRALHVGRHALTVTVTDPDDSSRTTSETLEFFTKKVEEDSEEDNDEGGAGGADESGSALAPPFDFTLSINTPGAKLQQGERLEFTLQPVRGLFPSDTVFEPTLVDKRGERVFTVPSQPISPGGRSGLTWSLETPVYLPEGEYSLQVEARFGVTSMTRSASFMLEVRPLFQLGDRGIITYADAASYLGWLLFGTLSTLVTFFLTLLREYWLYLHGIRHITGREFLRFGMILLRKGVSKL